MKKEKIFKKILKRCNEKNKSTFVIEQAEDFIRNIELNYTDEITQEMGYELISYGILTEKELNILLS